MQRLGSLPVFGVGSANGSDCPPQGEVALVVGLIPVSVSGAGSNRRKTSLEHLGVTDMACG